MAAQIFNLGKLRFTYKGVYSGSTTYQQNDVVRYNNSVYVYTNVVASSGNIPTDTSRWSQMIDGLDPTSGTNGQFLQTNGTSLQWSSNGTFGTLAATTKLTGPAGGTYVGSGAEAFDTTSGALTDAIAVFDIDGGESSFAQVAFRNQEPTSSTDIIAYMDNGNDSEGWVGIGIAGSNFDDATYGITGPGDGYIFHETKAGATGPEYTGNLVFATGANGSENKLVFAAGGFASGDTQMEITPGQNVHIEIPTPSTSPTTGALTVVGGVGIQGDMNIQGNVSIEGTITFGGAGTTVETSNLAVTDPAVFVGTNNQSDIVDLAFIGEYATTVSPIVATVTNKALTSNVATLTTSSAHTYLAGDVVAVTGVDATFNGTFNIIAVPTSTTFTYAKTAANVTSTAVSPTGTATVNARRKFAGIARDASDGVIKAFKDATTKPTSTINFSEAGLAYADVKANAIDVASATIGNVTNTEIQYLDGVTSAIQTQINNKLDTSTASTTYLPKFTNNMSGAILTFQAERNGNPTVGTLHSFGNGSTSSVMAVPVASKLVMGTFSIDQLTADAGTSITIQFYKNGVAQGSGYQLTVTAGTTNTAIGNYFSTPLQLAAGDQIAWIVTAVTPAATVTLASRSVVTWYLRAD